MFKKIILDNEVTRWSVNELGQVRNDENGHFLTGTTLSGYQYINFRWKGKHKNKSVHRIVAETFIPNPDNLPYVHHIDGNHFNNRMDNLQWVTEAENRKYALPPKHDKKRKMPKGEKNEEWRYFRDTVYQISNCGRVRNTKTNRIMRGSYGSDGYYRVEISFRNQARRKFLVHRLVWETFVGDEICVINHINGDKSDNRLINLENISQKENMIKAVKDTNAWNFRRVAQYDKQGNLIRTYLNASEAARSIGILPSSLRNTIRRKGYTRDGYYFEYLEEESSSTSINTQELNSEVQDN